jgi:hypothetical protein
MDPDRKKVANISNADTQHVCFAAFWMRNLEPDRIRMAEYLNPSGIRK